MTTITPTISDRATRRPKMAYVLVALFTVTACDSGNSLELEDELEDESSLREYDPAPRMERNGSTDLVPSSSRMLLASIREAARSVSAAQAQGRSLADTGCLFSSSAPVDSCLEIISSPAKEAGPCDEVVRGAFDRLEPQRSVDLWVDDTHESARLWFDPGAPGDTVCLEVSVENNDSGTCLYKDCLVNGGETWVEAAVSIHADVLREEIMSALGGPGAVPRLRISLNMFRVFQEAAGLEIEVARL